jgi:hypothetical protein
MIRYRARRAWDWTFNSTYGRFWGRLAVWAVLVSLVYVWFDGHTATPEEDRRIVAYLGGVLVMAMGVMLWTNRRGWSFEALGVFGTISGTGILYALLALSLYAIASFDNESRSDVVRALLVVGGTQLALALLWLPVRALWALWARRRGR